MLGSLSSFHRFIDSRFQFNVLLQNVGQRTDSRHRTREGGREEQNRLLARISSVREARIVGGVGELMVRLLIHLGQVSTLEWITG